MKSKSGHSDRVCHQPLRAVLSDLVASPRRNLLRNGDQPPNHSSKNKSGGWGIIPVLPLWCPMTDRAGPPSTDCTQRQGHWQSVRGGTWGGGSAGVLWGLKAGGGRVAKCIPTPIPRGDFCSPTPHLLILILSGVEGKRKQGSSGQTAWSRWLLSWSLYPAKGPAPYPHLQALDRCPLISVPPNHLSNSLVSRPQRYTRLGWETGASLLCSVRAWPLAGQAMPALDFRCSSPVSRGLPWQWSPQAHAGLWRCNDDDDYYLRDVSCDKCLSHINSFNLITTLGSVCYYYHLHFIDDKTGDQRG